MDEKTKSLDQQIKLITQICLLFSVFVVVNWILHFLVSTFSKTQLNNYAYAFRRNVSNSLQHFVIFLGLYAYSITQKSCILLIKIVGLKRKQILIIANWFVLARIIYGVFSVVDVKFSYNFRELGSTISISTIAILLLNVAGWNIFPYF